ncbi:MAG: EAL domain-containing protein [Gammaproteobacteria bacterium]|nr:EAL domain-containing protein [Gammaproteobacteria bacterium]MBU1977630.1 EAL domain-containing protein [Gammaproteobacteria bacterium]
MAGKLISSFLRSMPGRMVTGILLMNFVIGTVLISGVMYFVKYDYQAQFINHVRGQAQILSTLVGQDTRQDRVAALLTDIQLSGEVVYARYTLGSAADPTFREDLFFGEHGNKVYYLAVPVTNQDGAQLGTLLLGYDESFVNEKISHLYLIGFVMASIYLCALLLMSVALSMRLIRPLIELQHASREIAGGDMQRTLNVETNLTEINDLANDLEFMRREIVKRGEESAAQESRHRAVLENLSEGVIIINQSCQIESFNASAQRMFGYDADEVAGMRFYSLVVDETGLHESCARLLDGDTLSFVARRKNGVTFPMLLSVSAFRHGDQQLMAAVAQDISERKAFEEQLSQLAYYDMLTGLPNRRLFLDRLAQAVAQSQRHAKLLAVMFLDLDRFKNVNDTLGHEIGDELLRLVAERLRSVVRKCDTAARLGGDEFVILLDDIAHVRDAEMVAEKIIELFAQPFNIGGHELFSSTSIGITVFPLDADDTDTLLKNADAAMYGAKHQGRGIYRLYAPEMNASLAERVSMESALRKAIAKENLLLHYQPQILLQYQPQIGRVSGEIVGMEALVRWQHPELGLIMPDSFISLAEDSDLIIPLGEWVLHQACEQARIWRDAGLPPLRIAVNMSPRQLQHPRLLDQIRQTLARTGLDPTCLELEITESMILQHSDELIGTLTELRQMGISIAIDDFGTGHSSLSALQRLPVDVVKIDRSFVSNIITDANDASIVTAVIEMGQKMGLKIIAEGVETEDQMMFLQSRKCDFMQGYYFSKPLPAPEFEALLNREIANRNPLRVE